MLPFALLQIQRLSTQASGFILLWLPFAMGVTSVAGGALTDRCAIRPTLRWGAALACLGTALLATSSAHPSSPVARSLRLALIGLGLGLFTGPNQTLLFNLVRQKALGLASGLIGVVRNLGFELGPAVAGVVFAHVSQMNVALPLGTSMLAAIALVGWVLAIVSTRKSEVGSPLSLASEGEQQ